MFQVLDALFRVRQLFLSHLAHLLVALLLQHRQGVLHVLLGLFVLLVGLHNRGQIGLLLHQLGKPLGVLGHVRIPKHQHKLFIMNQNIVQFIKHNSLPIPSIKFKFRVPWGAFPRLSGRSQGGGLLFPAPLKALSLVVRRRAQNRSDHPVHPRHVLYRANPRKSLLLQKGAHRLGLIPADLKIYSAARSQKALSLR